MFKKSVKILLISLLLVFIFNISFCLADPCDPEKDMCYTPEITFPGFDKEIKVTPSLLGNYISALYQYLLYAAGVVAVVVIMIGGFQWITAGGNQSRIGAAKERITSAIIGLFLALGSYLLLFTISPDLIKIVDLSMPSIEPMNIYCSEIEGLTSVKFISHVNQLGTFNFEWDDVNNDGVIAGDETTCGNKYEYKREGIVHTCEGQRCLKAEGEDDYTQTCAMDSQCHILQEALCVGKKKGDSCGNGPGTAWPYGYCTKDGDDGGECRLCKEIGESCGGGIDGAAAGPQYACPNKNADGKCGKGTGDYCDGGFYLTGKCTEESH